eukprot:4251117-Pyramimonas_sp.AAC.3
MAYSHGGPVRHNKRGYILTMDQSQHAADAVYTLQGYLADATTLDLVYLTLLDVAQSERLRSLPVVAKCTVLLKRYLFRCDQSDA